MLNSALSVVMCERKRGKKNQRILLTPTCTSGAVSMAGRSLQSADAAAPGTSLVYVSCTDAFTITRRKDRKLLKTLLTGEPRPLAVLPRAVWMKRVGNLRR